MFTSWKWLAQRRLLAVSILALARENVKGRMRESVQVSGVIAREMFFCLAQQAPDQA